MPQIDDVKIRTASKAWLTALNAAYAAGEPIYEVDTGRMKIGQGALLAYADLPYVERGDPAVVSLGDVVKIINKSVTSLAITIPDTTDYESFQIILAGTSQSATADTAQLRFNGDTAANYDWQILEAGGTIMYPGSSRAATSIKVGHLSPGGSLGIEMCHSPVIIEVPLHRMTGGYRTTISHSGLITGSGLTQITDQRLFGQWRSAANIISASLFTGSGSAFTPGTQIICFGIRP